MGNAYWYIKIKLTFFLFKLSSLQAMYTNFFTADSRTIKMHFEFKRLFAVTVHELIIVLPKFYIFWFLY